MSLWGHYVTMSRGEFLMWPSSESINALLVQAASSVKGLVNQHQHDGFDIPSEGGPGSLGSKRHFGVTMSLYCGGNQMVLLRANQSVPYSCKLVETPKD
jgi:hypothetical protein